MDKPSLSPSPTPESSLETTQPSGHERQLERRAVRKLDCTILPVVTLIFLVAILDRTNIGNARVAGLQKDLHLTDTQYQTCLTVLFVPRLFLPILIATWGIIATLQGFVTSYAGLITVRLLLGLVEGPLSPGVTLYLSSFYTREDLSLRIALFMSGVPLSAAFSGLLAAAIGHMDGIGRKPGWAWIFILEGLFSVLIGIISFFLVPSTPRDSRFLTEYQKDIIMKHLARDRPTMEHVDKFSPKEVLRSIASPHVLIVLVMGFIHGMAGHGLGLFLPSIVRQLGFSPPKTQLLSVGPFLTGFIASLICAFSSDRYNSRGIPILMTCMLAIVGYALFLNAEHKLISYGALYLMAPGVYGAGPVVSAWLVNNSEPHYRRATTIALGAIASNAGGILSTWSFPTKDGPKFKKTITITLIFYVLLILCTLANMTYLSWRNKVKKRPGVRAKLLDEYVVAQKEGRLNAWIELGDRHPDFVYTI